MVIFHSKLLVYQRAWCNPNDLSPWHWRQKLGQHRAKILADFVVLVDAVPSGVTIGDFARKNREFIGIFHWNREFIGNFARKNRESLYMCMYIYICVCVICIYVCTTAITSDCSPHCWGDFLFMIMLRTTTSLDITWYNSCSITYPTIGKAYVRFM